MFPRIEFIVTLLAGLVVGALLCGQSRADTWLVSTVTSYHTAKQEQYNANNFGLGVEHDIADRWRASAGFYENSYYRRSWYAGASYCLWTSGAWKVGVFGAAVTGYGEPVQAALMPVLTYEAKTWGANIGIVPHPERGVGVIGLQLKYRLR